MLCLFVYEGERECVKKERVMERNRRGGREGEVKREW